MTGLYGREKVCGTVTPTRDRTESSKLYTRILATLGLCNCDVLLWVKDLEFEDDHAAERHVSPRGQMHKGDDRGSWEKKSSSSAGVKLLITAPDLLPK